MKSLKTQVTDSGNNNSDLSDLPIVVYLGYSIHGESSGTGAAIALAYYLAAAEVQS
jgi:hypothetical protein